MTSMVCMMMMLHLMLLILLNGVYHSRVVLTAPLPTSNVKDCQLETSSRGPDWYKIKRPTPEYLQFDADLVQYIHMPCAAGTVFDLKICGCTNLASYLFESLTLLSREMELRKFGNVTDDRLHGTADDSNNLRNFSPFSPRSTERPPTFIINTDTGEVKGCPFRGSPLGIRYYMIREYDEKWTNMKCGPVTVFSVKACTCIHEAQADMSQERKDSLVVLTDTGSDDKDSQNILSKGLGISVSDIIYNASNSPSAISPQIPADLRDVRTKDRIQPDADIFVPFIGDDKVKDILDKSANDKPDQLSNRNYDDDTDKKRVASLLLDTKKTIHIDLLDDVIPLEFKPVINLTRPLDVQEGIRGDKRKENMSHNTRNHEIIADVSGTFKDKINKDVLDDIKDDKIKSGVIENIVDDKIKVDLRDNITNDVVHADTNVITKVDNSGILTMEDGDEFMKKLEDLATKKMSESRKDLEQDGNGFLFAPPGRTGLSTIEIVQHKENSGQLLKKETDDEIYFPVVECHKMKVPELGKQYFKLHLWGIGWIPYRCEEDRIFAYNECACVKERDDDT